MVTRGRQRRATITDVAQHAQVSTTAVSKVLRTAYGVSEAMRTKVQAPALYDCVLDDDELGAQLVVEHLIGLGHRRVAHITQKDTASGRSAVLLRTIRARAHERLMTEHGLAGHMALAATSCTEEGGYEGARELLGLDPRPTVDQDGAIMGRTAGRLLLERIAGRAAAVRFAVTPTLVVRRSTASPRPAPCEGTAPAGPGSPGSPNGTPARPHPEP
ncbi:LacI family DNA-binding transcriptional regulator [Nonomuraea sp. GTA35]|uniref:LacI family DNA-binding transcriptional regulator n=1 Tax=Nonomuraea sp. GTA35 TaxID=1676746 RepID=UPI0035C0FD7C